MRYFFVLILVVLSTGDIYPYGYLRDINTISKDVWLTYGVTNKNEIKYCVTYDDTPKIENERIVVESVFKEWLNSIKDLVYVDNISTCSKTLLKDVKVKYAYSDKCNYDDDEQLKIIVTRDIKEVCGDIAYQYGGCFVKYTRELYIYPDAIAEGVNSRSFVHEIGHAFGLCDQYADALDNCDRATMTTIQSKESIMSHGYQINYDDIEGLVSLFKKFSGYFNENEGVIDLSGWLSRSYSIDTGEIKYRFIDRASTREITYRDGQITKLDIFDNKIVNGRFKPVPNLFINFTYEKNGNTFSAYMRNFGYVLLQDSPGAEINIIKARINYLKRGPVSEETLSTMIDSSEYYDNFAFYGYLESEKQEYGTDFNAVKNVCSYEDLYSKVFDITQATQP